MTTRLLNSFCCSVALLAMTAFPVVAQDDGNRREGGRFGGGAPFGGGMMGGRSLDATMVGLLMLEEVRKELEVDSDQEQALQKLAQENRGERPDFGNFRDASEAERREMFEKMRKEAEERAAKMRAGMEEILLPKQIDRLQEVAIQVLGTEALNSEKVEKELKITSEQKEKIAQAREEAQDSMREKMREVFSSGDREGIREKMAELRKGMEEKVVGALSQEQQTQFAAMKGEPFEMPENAFRGGRRGGGRGGDGDRGRDGDRGGDNN